MRPLLRHKESRGGTLTLSSLQERSIVSRLQDQHCQGIFKESGKINSHLAEAGICHFQADLSTHEGEWEYQMLNDQVSVIAKCPEIAVGGRLSHFLPKEKK